MQKYKLCAKSIELCAEYYKTKDMCYNDMRMVLTRGGIQREEITTMAKILRISTGNILY